MCGGSTSLGVGVPLYLGPVLGRVGVGGLYLGPVPGADVDDLKVLVLLRRTQSGGCERRRRPTPQTLNP